MVLWMISGNEEMLGTPTMAEMLGAAQMKASDLQREVPHFPAAHNDTRTLASTASIKRELCNSDSRDMVDRPMLSNLAMQLAALVSKNDAPQRPGFRRPGAPQAPGGAEAAAGGWVSPPASARSEVPLDGQGSPRYVPRVIVAEGEWEVHVARLLEKKEPQSPPATSSPIYATTRGPLATTRATPLVTTRGLPFVTSRGVLQGPQPDRGDDGSRGLLLSSQPEGRAASGASAPRQRSGAGGADGGAGQPLGAGLRGGGRLGGRLGPEKVGVGIFNPTGESSGTNLLGRPRPDCQLPGSESTDTSIIEPPDDPEVPPCNVPRPEAASGPWLRPVEEAVGRAVSSVCTTARGVAATDAAASSSCSTWDVGEAADDEPDSGLEMAEDRFLAAIDSAVEGARRCSRGGGSPGGTNEAALALAVDTLLEGAGKVDTLAGGPTARQVVQAYASIRAEMEQELSAAPAPREGCQSRASRHHASLGAASKFPGGCVPMNRYMRRGASGAPIGSQRLVAPACHAARSPGEIHRQLASTLREITGRVIRELDPGAQPRQPRPPSG